MIRSDRLAGVVRASRFKFPLRAVDGDACCRAPLTAPRDAAHRHRVLIVEDDGIAALLLISVVEAMGHDVVRAATGHDALELAESKDFDLVLLDLGLPDIDGIEVARRLRENDTTAPIPIPIVFVSGEHEPKARVEGFEAGAVDFITKPYDIPEIRARVHHQLETRRLRRQLERAAALLEQRVEERTEQLSARMTQLRTEVERRRALEGDLRRLADTDPVTGVLNQRGLPARLERWRARRSEGLVVAVEIDGWESVTGLLGHVDAEMLLSTVAARLASTNGEPPVGRFGASLFVTVLPAPSGSAMVALEDLRRALDEPVLRRRSMRLTFTIGAVEDPGSSATTSEVLRDSMLALHVAKSEPGSTVVLDSDRRAAIADDVALENELWGAADRGELVLQYQPIFQTTTLRRTGVEALVRWHHPARGLITPGRFIPIAERSGAISEIGRWTIEEATRQLGVWRAQGVVDHDVRMAVNVSAVDVIDLDLPRRVLGAIAGAGLAPSALEVELTETAVVRQGAAANQVLGALRAEGIGVCLDDFGTGSSSLTLLQQTPADVVKIDRSFVSRIGDDPFSLAIVESTIGLAHRLGMTVVGEGVETTDQLELLTALGCDAVQGFLLARPLDADDVVELATPGRDATAPDTWLLRA